MLRAQWMVAIHPAFGSYDPTMGLVLGEGGLTPKVEYGERPQAPRYQYDFESWVDHARRVRDQGRVMHQSHRRATEKLARAAVLPNVAPEQIELIIELTCALHDAGKLTVKWQEVAWRWQRAKDERLRANGTEPPERPKVPLAHTSFDPVADREYRRLLQYQFPNHAVEGAYAVEVGVCQRLINLCGQEAGLVAALATVSAIARHHAPKAKHLGEFTTNSVSKGALTALLGDQVSGLLRDSANRVEANSFGDRLLNLRIEEHESCWPLFAFLIRRVRLADQSSFK
jgi:CRISPR-associated endonuclease/helicase Cas3